MMRSEDKRWPESSELRPSLLSANLLNLKADLDELTSLGLRCLHVDVMDGHFVPNLTFGPAMVQQLRTHTSCVLDVHLMITLDSPLVEAFIQAGAHHLTFHVEATPNPQQLIDLIHQRGLTAGLSLKPGTPAEAVQPYLSSVDEILVMTVEPGFGGQSFMEDQLEKIGQLHAMIQTTGRSITLAVDGGINSTTLPLCAQKGATAFIAGHGFFQGGVSCFSDNHKKLLQGIRETC